jgi:site-specific recombinase XerD
MKKFKKNPAMVFSNSLGSQKSAKTTLRVINYLCNIHSENDYKTLDWSLFDYTEALKLRKKLIDKGLKATSINSYISTIKSVCRESWRLKIIDTETFMRINDIKNIKGKSAPTGKALSIEDLNAAVNYRSKNNKDIRDSAIIAIGYGTGLRAFEMAKIKLKDLYGNAINVIGKGRIERKVYLPEFAIKKLARWLSIRGKEHGFLFKAVQKGGEILNRGIAIRTISDLIEKRCENVGIERFTPHDLRRSFATNLLNSGVDVFLVQKLMRHSNVNTTKIYDKRGEEEAARAVELLPF